MEVTIRRSEIAKSLAANGKCIQFCNGKSLAEAYNRDSRSYRNPLGKLRCTDEERLVLFFLHVALQKKKSNVIAGSVKRKANLGKLRI